MINKEEMKQELENICRDLSNWSKKYGKDYVSLAKVGETTMANVDTEDKDYQFLNIFNVDD